MASSSWQSDSSDDDIPAPLPYYGWTFELKDAVRMKEELRRAIMNHLRMEASAQPDREVRDRSYDIIGSQSRKLWEILDRLDSLCTHDFNQAVTDLTTLRTVEELIDPEEVTKLVETQRKVAKQEEEVRKLEEIRERLDQERSESLTLLTDFYSGAP